MTSSRWLGGILIAIAAGLAAPQLTAQVQMDVPPPVASHWMTNPRLSTGQSRPPVS